MINKIIKLVSHYKMEKIYNNSGRKLNSKKLNQIRCKKKITNQKLINKKYKMRSIIYPILSQSKLFKILII